MYGSRAKLGQIAVSNDLVMDCDLRRMAPEGVAVYTARMYYDNSLPDPLERLAQMAPYARQAATDLGTLGLDAIVYGCTSGSFFRGRAWDEQYMSELSGLAGGVPVVSTARASAEALQALGMRRICVATPYTDDVNALLPPFLADFGIEVINLTGAQLTDAMAMMRLQPPEIRSLVRSALRPGADGVFFSCTGVPVVELIAELEEDLGLPVVSANQASMWAILRLAGVRARIQGFGSLFDVQDLAATPQRELVHA